MFLKLYDMICVFVFAKTFEKKKNDTEKILQILCSAPKASCSALYFRKELQPSFFFVQCTAIKGYSIRSWTKYLPHVLGGGFTGVSPPTILGARPSILRFTEVCL